MRFVLSTLVLLSIVLVLQRRVHRDAPRRLMGRRVLSSDPDGYDFDRIWEPIQEALCPNMVPNTDMETTLFALARDEIGMKRWQGKKPNEPFFHRFFHDHQGGVVYSSPDNDVNIVYPYVWKAAHLQIKGWFRDVFTELPGQFQEMERSEIQDTIRSLKQSGADPCVLTAIRDPIAHFLSGYNEIEFRIRKHRDSILDQVPKMLFTRYEPGRTQRFKEFVADVLGGPNLEGWKTYNEVQIAHIYSMTSILTMLAAEGVELKSYLPSLKNLDDTWPQFLYDTCPGLPEELASLTMDRRGQHESTADNVGTYEAAKEVWSEKGPTARALCALHAMDYACWRSLPRGIPDICKDVYSSHNFVDGIFDAMPESSGS